MPRLDLRASRPAALFVALLAGLLAVSALAGCSDDDEGPASSDRGVISFEDAPAGSTALGLCASYDIDQIKELLDGGSDFRRLAPEAIGTEGDPVTGEACAWERKGDDGDLLTLRIEARDFGDDVETIADQFTQLQDGTLAAEPVTGLGDAAFSSVSDETTLLQIRSGGYLLTLASRGAGSLEPVPLDALELLAASGLEQLP